MRHFFLGAALPPLNLGEQPDISFFDLMERFALNLSPKDQKKVDTLRGYFDVQNIRFLWREEPLDPRGTVSIDELESRIENKELLPESVEDFLWDVDAEERLAGFSRLLSLYLEEQSEKQKGFLRDFFRFEREWRLILAAFRAKQMGLDLLQLLKDEDPNDPMIATLIAGKDAPNFSMPYGYADLEATLGKMTGSPMEVYKAFAGFRFERISEMVLCELSSLDWLLGYMVRLTIVEEWNEMESRSGEEMLQEHVRYE